MNENKRAGERLPGKTAGKRLLALLLTLAMALGVAGCGGEPESADDEKAPVQTQTPQNTAAADNVGMEQAAFTNGLSMSVDSDTQTLIVERAKLDTVEPPADGVWTIFVYLCGTDLESEGGCATDDLQEMIDGASDGSVRYVVQTGGTKQWMNEVVSGEKLQRFVIQNGDIQLVDEQPLANMGSGDTLTGFLHWGLENYASEHIGFVFWNHGGGSITGVCFDELNDMNSLDLKEIDAALYENCSAAGRRFDFIGLDACLMDTVETANIAATYADYMVASEELEPGCGWEYTSIGNYITANPGVDAARLGVAICDGFMKGCAAVGDDKSSTLAVIDLARIDELLVAFNGFASNMFNAAADETSCAAMVRGIGQAENFGGNNKSEGYTNMVDMGALVAACGPYADGADQVIAALGNAVVYSVNGPYHKNASGLSMYYPLCVQGSEELSIFGNICPSPYYISFVDRLKRGGVVEDLSSYDGGQWFDESGEWTWGGENGDGNWDYLNGYAQTGESQHITFATAPHLDENGSFWFELDDAGYDAASDVFGIVYQYSADGEDIIELGETYDLQGGFDTGVFADDFDGWWISLPDGQNLATYIVDKGLDYTIYTSPIRLNGDETNLRIKLDYTAGTITIEGAWDGLDESGAAARDVVKLRSGDVITPLYYACPRSGGDEFFYYGMDYTFSGEPEVYYDVMEDGSYLYAFCIDDIYGDYYLSEFVSFNVENGEVYYSAA